MEPEGENPWFPRLISMFRILWARGTSFCFTSARSYRNRRAVRAKSGRYVEQTETLTREGACIEVSLQSPHFHNK